MGIAGMAFGWTPDVFMRATPHEFHALYEVYREMNKPRDEGDGG